MHPHELESAEKILESANHRVDGTSDPFYVSIYQSQFLCGWFVMLTDSWVKINLSAISIIFSVIGAL